MIMKSEFKIIREIGGTSFEEVVLENISKGWRPIYGGLTMCQYGDRGFSYALIMKRTWIRRLLATS